MAEVPPGPSSLLAPPGDALSPFPGGGGATACPGALDEEEEEEGGQEQPRGGGKGGPQQQHRPLHHHHPPHHNHQLNGLISPELRHLRASLKSKILSSEGAEGPENKRAGKTMGSGQPPPVAASCSSPLPNRLPEPQARTAPPAATGDRRQPATATAARNGLAGGLGLEEDEPEEGDEGEEEEESLLLLSTSLAAACSLKGSGTDSPPEEDLTIRYVRYESELQMPDIMRLITKDLSEPYSIYTYRYFIHNWPQLCFLAMVGEECVGAIVCKLDMHKKMFRRGYIAMLAVDSKYRRKGIGTDLVKKAIYAMVEGDCDEVVLETEITNKSALKLYENLGFVRDKRLFRYYLNGVDALRLKLWLR
ncbi:N-alpha-acetyltransferase 30 isoform X1 [Chelonoidis abingdonii]|uniref:N-alpha-acetyltransferase 30 isoform X1 n=1 Tax=Chelonoidis abingdonii TaxID=106734 RepID=UPI0013F1A4D6|nr:N-alpha-acetyltransferase 30 isoform X1 [Chelonoidis abingdonii]XP_032625103.1 N-alpha-acetyltransferase 30 isoform X1 [Chelonoidis abingdonii]